MIKMLSENIPLCGTLLGTKKIRNDAIETKSVEVESSIEQALNGRQKAHLYQSMSVEDKISLCHEEVSQHSGLNAQLYSGICL
jgi:hypothetical protein